MANLFQASAAANLALHSMALLAQRPGERRSARELAATLDASEAHLAKVLQSLERSGLVAGTRGPAGGYRLGRDAGDISLREIYEAIEGPLNAGSCIFSTPICGDEECPLSGFFSRMSSRVADKLGRTRLSDMNLKSEPAAKLHDKKRAGPKGERSKR